jgi:hypothetical protein
VGRVIKVTLVCDRCSAVIAEGISANAVRLEAQALYGRREGNDLCLKCNALALPSPTSTEERARMSELLFTCPRTGRQVPTGIETDPQSLRAAWKRTLRLGCPHCGETHELSVSEAYLDSALKGGTEPSG